MEKRIREWLPTLVKHGVRGADAIFSCLGPALESYSRYEKVLTAADREVPLGGDPDAIEPEQRGFLAYVFETLSKEALRQVLGDAETEGFEEDSRMTALFLWTLQATKANGNGRQESRKPPTTSRTKTRTTMRTSEAEKGQGRFLDAVRHVHPHHPPDGYSLPCAGTPRHRNRKRHRAPAAGARAQRAVARRSRHAPRRRKSVSKT